MEFQGTKGEWEVLTTKDSPLYNGDFWTVIQTPDFAFDVMHSKCISLDETKANAKLIAAAPELLKAAIKLSKAISEGNPHLLSEGNLEIKTAIKKAL